MYGCNTSMYGSPCNGERKSEGKEALWNLWTNCDAYSVWLVRWIMIVPKGGW